MPSGNHPAEASVRHDRSSVHMKGARALYRATWSSAATHNGYRTFTSKIWCYASADSRKRQRASVQVEVRGRARYAPAGVHSSASVHGGNIAVIITDEPALAKSPLFDETSSGMAAVVSLFIITSARLRPSVCGRGSRSLGHLFFGRPNVRLA